MAPLTSANSATSLRGGCTNGNKNSVQKYLTNCKSLYSCIYCRTHLANHDELISRSFQGNHGRAYLFNSVINVSCGQAVQRELNTGSHAVADIFCENCETTLGWKYEKAYVETQKYKEGKYIIELAHVVRDNRHLELDKGEIYFNKNNNRRSSQHRSPLSPPSPSQWSSPTSSSNDEVEEDEEDEELIFPFYDDLCANRSSYPIDYSSSHHGRIRRSLYLDSAPYDWKNISTLSSSTSKEIQPNTKTLASSLESSNLSSSTSTTSSPSSSSSSSSNISLKPEHRQNSYLASNERYTVIEQYKQKDDNDYETQFKFEADKPAESTVIEATHEQIEHCDRELDTKHAVNGLNQAKANCDFIKNVTNGSRDKTEESSVSVCSGVRAKGDVSGGELDRLSNSVSLDDEEFYDCFTDHDASKLMAASDSTSTLKIAE